MCVLSSSGWWLWSLFLYLLCAQCRCHHPSQVDHRRLLDYFADDTSSTVEGAVTSAMTNPAPHVPQTVLDASSIVKSSPDQ